MGRQYIASVYLTATDQLFSVIHPARYNAHHLFKEWLDRVQRRDRCWPRENHALMITVEFRLMSMKTTGDFLAYDT
jgi:hypothetical protein